MKRNLYALLLVFCVAAIATAQVPKKILVEETTQASCPPCATQNPPFDARMEMNTDKVVVMKYQVWWPGFDPMYLENTADVDARVGFLGPNAAPNIYVNAGSPQSLASFSQAVIDNLYASETSPISIALDHNINDATGEVDIDVTIKNESNDVVPGGMYRLITVLQEDEIKYASPPGTNGERDFLWVMKKMLPDANGTLLSQDLGPGEEISFTFSEPIPWYVKDLGYVAASAWVENPASRSVLQAEHSPHKPLVGNYPDVASTYSINGYDGYCDTEVDANFQVRNAGSEEVTSFDIAVVNADGSLTVADSWTGNLAVGATESVDITGIQLGVGANGLTAIVNNINGLPDKNGHNTVIDNTVFYVLPTAPFAEEVQEGFNITQLGEPVQNAILDNPNGVRLFTVNQAISQIVTWPLGGNGNSDGCIRYDLLQWAPGLEASLVFEKVDLSNIEETKLSFTHAYALRGGFGNDRIVIEASSDCAQTWTTLYDQLGSDIVTGADPGAQARFYPRPNEWADVEIDASQFDGEGEVIFRFRGVSGASQAYYLDDIQIKGKRSTSSSDIEFLADLVTFPNPASDVVNIGFSLTEAVDLDITVTDLSGKVIDQLGSFSYPSGEHNLQWNPVQNGTYLINIRSGQAVTTERVTVVK